MRWSKLHPTARWSARDIDIWQQSPIQHIWQFIASYAKQTSISEILPTEYVCIYSTGHERLIVKHGKQLCFFRISCLISLYIHNLNLKIGIILSLRCCITEVSYTSTDESKNTEWRGIGLFHQSNFFESE